MDFWNQSAPYINHLLTFLFFRLSFSPRLGYSKGQARLVYDIPLFLLLSFNMPPRRNTRSTRSTLPTPAQSVSGESTAPTPRSGKKTPSNGIQTPISMIDDAVDPATDPLDLISVDGDGNGVATSEDPESKSTVRRASRKYSTAGKRKRKSPCFVRL